MADRSEANKQVVLRHLLEACGEGRPEIWMEIMHPDYVIHHPWAKPGRAAYIEACSKYWGAISRPRFEMLHIVAQGDLVWVHYIEHGQILAPIFDLKEAGGTYAKPGMALYRIENGLMVEGWAHEDDLGFMRQLGIKQYGL